MSVTKSGIKDGPARRPQYPPGSKYSLTQTSPCDPIISEILPHKLFISNIEGTADTAHLQVSFFRAFAEFISLVPSYPFRNWE